MTNEDETALMNRYRASVEKVQSPNLDRIVRAAAARQATRTRFSRRLREFYLMLAIASFTFGTAWHVHQSNSERHALAVTDYGKIEGFSISYLLQVGTQKYPGPGTIEGSP